METCDALTRLNNIFQKNAETSPSDPVIDITGEEGHGGATSEVFECNKCEYKTSQKKNLTKHKKSEHEESILPCEICEFVGKSMVEYNNHVKEKHAEQNNVPKKNNQTNIGNSNTNNTAKTTKKNYVEIPCDICSFKSESAEDFIKHIETKHQQKSKEVKEKPKYNCDKCDYEGNGEEHFKKHLEVAHKLSVWRTQEVQQKKFRKLCLNWNRGHCLFDSKCRYVHEEIEACKFNRRCSRPDCTYWHESQTGKFPFF